MTAPRIAEPEKAQVFILTGFLGSGKTTLLNRILTAPHGRRVAVIVNEFGSVGIDHHLLISAEHRVMEMSNGCICCSVRGDLVQNLFQLIERRDQFDIVVIETTGLAEPGPVAQSLYVDERIRREFTLQGVVALVDAKHFPSQLANTHEAQEQIAFADLVLLNKTDLVDELALQTLEDDIHGANRVAKIVRTRNSEIDLAEIFDIQLVAGGTDEAGLACAVDCAEDHDHHHHPHGGRGHNHLGGIETVSIVEPGVLDGLRLSLWFRDLMMSMGPRLMRMKGILNLWGDDDRFFFQGVQMEFEGKPGPPWPSDEERLNRLVFIGRELDREAIVEGFRRCLIAGEQTGSRLADPFGRDNIEISPYRLEQIRYWMRQNFGYAKDIPLVVKEVPCMKPACPPIETAIMAIMRDEPPRMFKVQKPIDEITFDHIYDLMENPMPCC